jgi:hypothetical protein
MQKYEKQEISSSFWKMEISLAIAAGLGGEGFCEPLGEPRRRSR